MNIVTRTLTLLMAFGLFFGAGCVSGERRHFTANRLLKLERGLSHTQTTKIFGTPVFKKEFAGTKVWKYRLHSAIGGWVPLYLLFNNEERLQEWFQDEQSFTKWRIKNGLPLKQ